MKEVSQANELTEWTGSERVYSLKLLLALVSIGKVCDSPNARDATAD
jgi:hypothetical protein